MIITILISSVLGMVSYSKDQIATVEISNHYTSELLKSLSLNASIGLEFWTNSFEVGVESRFHIPSKSIDFMSTVPNLNYTIVIDDLQKLIDTENMITSPFVQKADDPLGFFSKYATSSSLHDELLKVNGLEMKVIGKTFENRDIKMYTIGNGTSKIFY